MRGDGLLVARARMGGRAGLGLILSAVAVIALLGAYLYSGGSNAPGTAFAQAPAGHYAVVARPAEKEDIVGIVPEGDPAHFQEVARVPHLPGFYSRGGVSPDGRQLALVTVDAGSQAQPGASLLVLNLETGALTRLAVAVDYLQPPVWAPDGKSVVVTRTATDPARATIVRVPLDLSGEQVLADHAGVLGAYPVAFDPSGALVHVVIDARGSVLVRGDAEIGVISPSITRDWSLSPDGATLAFIETTTDGGVRYLARTYSLAGSATAQSLGAADGPQSLGSVWRPGSTQPTFGSEPGGPNAVTAQGAGSAGFDVPLGYNDPGTALAVEHWSGTSFAQPGTVGFQVVRDDGSRRDIPGVVRFFGWASR